MDLPLKHVTTTLSGSISVVRAVIVELEQDGLRGYGEAYEDKNLGIRVEEIAERIEKSRDQLSSYALADPYAFDRYISPFFGSNLPALCAVEMAACDLWGKLRSQPLWQIWRYDVSHLPLSSYSIGQDSVERAIEKFEEVPDWPLYRVELGNRNDIPLLEELRHRTKAPFRIDVSGNWTLNQALDYLAPLQDLGVELIEQPLPRHQWEQMKILKENSPIPIYADESCLNEEELERCAEYFHGVNLRPIRFGGMIQTRAMIAKAKALGLKTMIGNPVESTVAASAVAQFAPILDAIYIDGPLLIDKRVGLGVELDHGKIILPEEDGTGLHLPPRF